MSNGSESLEALTIAPHTLLAALAGSRQARSGKRRLLYDLMFDENGSLLYPVVQRLYNDRVGGLLLYALGVRTIREMERVERARRRNR